MDLVLVVVKEFALGGKTYRPGDSFSQGDTLSSKIRQLLNQRFLAPQPQAE